MAVRVEEQRQLAAEQLEKKVQLAELTHSQREKVWMEEMTEGLLSDGEEGSHASDSDEEVGMVLKRPVRAEDRKTKKQRRKERMRKEMVAMMGVYMYIRSIVRHLRM